MKLVLENVNRIYEKGGDKTQALCDINVSFHAGEQVMIIGESEVKWDIQLRHRPLGDPIPEGAIK